MKWYQVLCLAGSLALFAPAVASAQPGPHHGGPGPVAGPHSNAKPGPGDRHDKRGDGRDDRRDDHRGPQASMPGPHPGPGAAHRAPRAPMTPVAPPPVRHPMSAPAPAHRPGPAIPPPPPGYDHRRHGMHPYDFDNYLRRLDRISFKADKVRYIIADRSYWFTSSQVRNIIDHIAYDSDRVQIACQLYPRVVDRQNWGIVIDGLSYQSNREMVLRCSR